MLMNLLDGYYLGGVSTKGEACRWMDGASAVSSGKSRPTGVPGILCREQKVHIVY